MATENHGPISLRTWHSEKREGIRETIGAVVLFGTGYFLTVVWFCL